MDMASDIITATIPEFRRLSGISRSRIYELLDAGEIESIHIGARRLVLIESYRRLIERSRAAPSPAAPPRLVNEKRQLRERQAEFDRTLTELLRADTKTPSRL
jgi:hypothetical protein